MSCIGKSRKFFTTNKKSVPKEMTPHHILSASAQDFLFGLAALLPQQPKIHHQTYARAEVIATTKPRCVFKGVILEFG